MAAPTQRKPGFVDETELYLINYWAAYRNPNAPQISLAEAKKTYRVDAYTPPIFAPVAIPPRLDPLRQKKTNDFKDRAPKTTEEVAFLTANQRGLWTPEVSATNWRGTKFLGEGANAKVGLWEYSGDAENAPLRKQIVIKQSNDSDMANEANIMDTFRPNVHVLAQVKKAEIVRDSRAEGLPPDSVGQVRRLYLEYCPNGDLWDLLNRRIFTYGPFQENTLWLIFKCLADALGMLHHGIEFTFNVDREAQVIVKKNNRPIVHFDLKLENVLLGGNDENHTITPVLKAEFVVPIQKLGKDYFEYDAASYDRNGTTRKWRGTKGTPSYHPPEQFTERWDFSNYQCLGEGLDPRDRVAGNFSDKTNTWQVGTIMWRLIVLSTYNRPEPAAPLYADGRDGPDWTRPFIPNFSLNGSPPKCCTYGPELRAFSNRHDPPGPYSNTLIDIVFECLYELPRWRPTAQELRTRIARMFKPDQTEVDMFTSEPLESLMPAVPPAGGVPGAPVENPIAFPAVVVPAAAAAARPILKPKKRARFQDGLEAEDMQTPGGESSGTRTETRPAPGTSAHADIGARVTLGGMSSAGPAFSDAESRSPGMSDMRTVVGTRAPALGSAFGGIEGFGDDDENDDSGFVDAGPSGKRKKRGL